MTKAELFAKYPNSQCPECGDVRQYLLKGDRFICVNGHRQKFKPAQDSAQSSAQ